MSVSLQGWHPGERSVHDRLHFSGPMAMAYTWIDSSMPEQHRVFHSRNLPFVPLTTLDQEGRPWSCIAAGKTGKPGFISSPNETELVLDVHSWPGDPLFENLGIFEDGEKKALVAGIGIEFSTRRRNKFAGSAFSVQTTGEFSRRLRVQVNQAIGNCPKYINVRDLVQNPDSSPKVVHNERHLSDGDRLPSDVISFITRADTVFLGSSYVAKPENAKKFPSHVGMNQRGGRAGFVRVLPSDGRAVFLPDYSGNRLMTSLGNIEATPLASLSFVDFTTGDILYLTCDSATNHVGEQARALMPRQNVLTSFRVTGYILVSDALPLRQRVGSTAERSPYSPPVKLLAEELRASKGTEGDLGDISTTVTRIEILSETLARFTFETSQPVTILPGQAAILDFSEVLGTQEYAHMAAPGSESSLNDDRIRTWTVSSAHMNGATTSFEITMRLKEGGLVTGALFAIARHAQAKMPHLLDDTREVGLSAKLVGISGTFTLSFPTTSGKDLESAANKETSNKLLWIAGGIGVTPFLSMLSSIASSPQDMDATFDIVLFLSTREPDLLVRLVKESLAFKPPGHVKSRLNVDLHLFTLEPVRIEDIPDEITLHVHQNRFGDGVFERLKLAGVNARTAYLCGPPEFEQIALKVLTDVGISSGDVLKEGFEY